MTVRFQLRVAALIAAALLGHLLMMASPLHAASSALHHESASSSPAVHDAHAPTAPMFGAAASGLDDAAMHLDHCAPDQAFLSDTTMLPGRWGIAMALLPRADMLRDKPAIAATPPADFLTSSARRVMYQVFRI